MRAAARRRPAAAVLALPAALALDAGLLLVLERGLRLGTRPAAALAFAVTVAAWALLTRALDGVMARREASRPAAAAPGDGSSARAADAAP